MARFSSNYSGVGAGGELTVAEELMVQKMADGTYFVYNEIPTGDINSEDGVTGNTTFTLLFSPNPASSLHLILQGQTQEPVLNVDFALSGSTITMTAPPILGMKLLAKSYTVSPV